MSLIDWPAVLDDLRSTRGVYHSEADIQHALAWSVRAVHPTYRCRLEVRYPDPVVPGRRERVDLVVRTPGGVVAVEVKYLTLRAELVVAGERFDLQDHGAQDRRSFDVVMDLVRVERMVSTGFATEGAVLVVTNDPHYWNLPTHNRPTGAAAFRLHEGRTVSGVLAWGEQAGPGTRSGHDFLTVTGSYSLGWQDFHEVPGVRRGVFRSLLIEVPRQS